MNPSASSCPSYKAKPIRRLASLARALGTDEPSLRRLTESASDLYRVAQEIPKDDGSIRRTYDALRPLKDVHRRIKLGILDRVSFPAYLTGSIKGRDYKVNAALHAGTKIVISEDIGSFFPSTNARIVFDIWRNFFGFSEEVAACLTSLTTRDGALPQGAITSPQLANLVFWRYEPALQAQLAEQGIIYSRFVDDMATSSRAFVTADQKTEIIAAIYGMMGRRGYHPKRNKHEIQTARERMAVTTLGVNEKPGLAPAHRAKIRAMVHHLENQAEQGEDVEALSARLRSVAGNVALLGRFHPGKALALKRRVALIKKIAQPDSTRQHPHRSKRIHLHYHQLHLQFVLGVIVGYIPHFRSTSVPKEAPGGK